MTRALRPPALRRLRPRARALEALRRRRRRATGRLGRRGPARAQSSPRCPTSGSRPAMPRRRPTTSGRRTSTFLLARVERRPAVAARGGVRHERRPRRLPVRRACAACLESTARSSSTSAWSSTARAATSSRPPVMSTPIGCAHVDPDARSGCRDVGAGRDRGRVSRRRRRPAPARCRRQAPGSASSPRPAAPSSSRDRSTAA